MSNKRGTLFASEKYCKRLHNEKGPGKYRSEFMRDRDRILYSKPFRRLSRKTQIFLPASDDHVRTRLTHTLEVAQIATTSASSLGIDPNLTESIALGHDIGHTPFGHSGERALNLIVSNCDPLGNFNITFDNEEMGFKHNLQGLRIATDYTDLYQDISGLNLTNFTLWGIQNHTGKSWKYCTYLSDDNDIKRCQLLPKSNYENCNRIGKEIEFYNIYNSLLNQKDNDYPAWSLEGMLVEKADEISQRHHDIEDGIIAKVIDKKELLDLIESTFSSFFNRNEKHLLKKCKKISIDESNDDYLVQYISKLIVGSLNRNLIEYSLDNISLFKKDLSIEKRNHFVQLYPSLRLDQTLSNNIKLRNIVAFPPDVELADQSLQNFLKSRVLNSYQVQRMDGKARFIIRQLFKAYLTNPQQLPDSWVKIIFKENHSSKLTQHIGDIRTWLSSNYFSEDIRFKKKLFRTICDYISTMTDDFALIEHQRLYSSQENINLRKY